MEAQQTIDSLLDTNPGVIPVPHGYPEVDPQTVAKRYPKRKVGLERKLLKLTDPQKKKVTDYLKSAFWEWRANTTILKSKLRRINNVLEGIKEPKNFPWEGCSNIHIPMFEIHITILHSVASSTMLEMEPMYMVKQLLPGGEEVDKNIELFLHWVCKIQLKLDEVLSDIFWTTYQDGLGIGDLDWVAEYDRRFDSITFMNVEEFVERFPDAKTAGVSQKQYNDYLNEIVSGEEGLELEIQETVPRYVGPKIRVVLLKDFVVIPVTSPTTEYAQFVGDVYVNRADYFKKRQRDGWMDNVELEKMLITPGLAVAIDEITSSQDRIEGLTRNRTVKADEYRVMQGVLSIDIFDKGYEEKFLVKFHPETEALLWIERFPYWHNRCKYITWRFKKRPNRLLGQSLYDQIIDLNDECDAQHQQRIDSRTITTVPSFLKMDTSKFDPSRKDQKFRPGVTFKVTSMNEVKQFEIKQTDMGESLQEESNLFMIADMRTGASQLRSGRETQRDPRASGKKTALLLQQSNNRIDDHMRELKIGTNELATQILELYYQYAPEEMIRFSTPEYNTNTGEVMREVPREIERTKLRNSNMRIDVTRTSIMDNPEQMAQRSMVLHQMLINEPLIGGNFFRRRESLRRLLRSMRERNLDKLLPTIQQFALEMQVQNAIMQDPTNPELGKMMAIIGQTGMQNGGPEGNVSGPPRSEVSPRTVNQS